MADKKKQNPMTFYAKYMGLAFQMFFLLLIGWFIGKKADEYFSFQKPYLALALTFIFLLGFLIKIYRDVVSGKL